VTDAHEADETEPDTSPPPRFAAAVGWAAFVLMAVAALLLAKSAEPSEPRPTHAESARAFLRAWEQYRTGTFVAVGTFRREVGADPLVSPYVVAQRPPSRTIFQFGAVEAMTEDGVERCSADPDEEEHCTTSDATQSYKERVNEEITALLGYFFANDPPLYEVVEVGEGCFELTLRRELIPAPYGLSTRFCFDSKTGAMIEMVQHHDRGIDVIEISAVSPTVSDADLAPAIPDDGQE
jgi:hypothetical protein